MKVWAVTIPGEPLEKLELPTPQPSGSEILVEVTHCGVCHSDLHFWKGEYDLGAGKVMKITDRGVELPRAPGHEMAGRVVAKGPEAIGVEIGDVRIVYPWIGCGRCAACLAEQDNMCLQQQSLGVVQHGGFGSHVLVPHSRYLMDPGDVPLGLAATYACSGITAYAAIKKIMPIDPEVAVVLIGAGGVGLTGIAMLRAFGHRRIVSVDTAADKRAAAEAAGAITVDGAAEDLVARIQRAADGPVLAVIDFVNISATARTGWNCLTKGGTLVAVGVGGGELTLSLASMVFRANAFIGTVTGSLQDLRDVLALANVGKLPPTPIIEREKSEANAALRDLKDGLVTGRQVLVGSMP